MKSKKNKNFLQKYKLKIKKYRKKRYYKFITKKFI